MKFAYLIIVHTRFDQVAKLLELLDDEKNDLYVHIDEKVANSFDIFQRTLKPSVQKSKIYLVNPHNVTWGGKSQIEAELELLKAAKVIKYRFDEETIDALENSCWWKLQPEELMEFYPLIDTPLKWANAIINRKNNI